MIRARSARLRRVVAARTHAVSCARSCAATANLVATAMPCLHHAITGMASELTRRDTRGRGACHRHAGDGECAPVVPYLFHGRDCAPARIRKRSTRYACLGNLRLAFQKACEAAGLVVGRKHGGLVWHCTRNTAATDLAAAGCTIEDVMKVGGWQTADVARRYDLGNLEALRARIAAARERGKVVRLADKRKAQA